VQPPPQARRMEAGRGAQESARPRLMGTPLMLQLLAQSSEYGAILWLFFETLDHKVIRQGGIR
jgi:hypothetical protein